ncbi:MAG: IgGFc-binding protein [Ignavibacteriae bacterium]|nr:IgGFc-binding protein [Ignavibacteriota bacterium]
MQTFYRCCVFLLCVFSAISTGSSQSNFKNSNLSTQGKEFWLAVPLNDVKAQPTIQLEFYVTSKYNTLVTLEVPGTGFIRSKKVNANEVVIFSTKDGSASYDFEIVTSQIPDPRGVHIYADKPVSVYMMNAKQVTADGYLALPVRTWGTEYIHCSYYDFNEFRPLAGGFIVVASEDTTEVYITLRGRGGSIAKTASGSKIGDIIGPIILKKGEVYNVKGDATTRGEFDLTGTKITANKPIGLISYHERTMLPVNCTDGRDHMCEMIPPVSAWGKKHYSIELQRADKGDFYRFVGSEPNTHVKMSHYDKTTKAELGKRDITLSKAGDFYEDYNTWTGNGATVAFNGVTVWESDKPILVCQYAYSANWDKGTMFDPFMIVLTPQEQFLSSSIFQTPISTEFVNNYYSFIVEGDTTDTEHKKLKSFIFDGNNVHVKYPDLLKNNIPGTNLYWGRLPVSQGAHNAKADTRFGGYCYGFGTFNSYGWPATLNTRCLAQVDTLPPVITRSGKCGEYYFHATEIRDFPSIFPDTNQFDQGILDISIVDSISYNFKLELITADKIVPLPKVTVFDFKLSVIDKSKDAFAVVEVVDRAGNYVLDTVRYIAQQTLTIAPESLSLQVAKADTTLSNTITITNPTRDTVFIESVTLSAGKAFKISKGMISSTFALAPADSHVITIDYTSINASSGNTTPEKDSIIIKFTSCSAEKHIQLEGKFVMGDVKVSPVEISIPVSVLDSVYNSTITISNPSSNIIYISSTYLNSSSVFTIGAGNVDSILALTPGDSHSVVVQYKRTSTLDTVIDLDTLHVEVLKGSAKLVPLEGKFAKSLISVSATQLVFNPSTSDSASKASLTVTNKTLNNVTLHSIKLNKGSVFSIVQGNLTSDIILEPENTHYITLQYSPTAASIGNIDRDTLHITVIGGLERTVTLEGQIVPLGVEENTSYQSGFTLLATPNPADESVTISVNGNHSDRIHFRLFDAIGQEISACSADLESGSTVQLPNITGLPVGTYRLVASSVSGLIISTRLLMIQR